MRVVLSCLTLWLLAAAPAWAGAKSPEALGQAFVAAVFAGDLEALAETYAEDAILYPVNGMSVRGRAEIRRAWDDFFRGRKVARFETSDVQRQTLGRDLVSSGLWTMTLVGANGTIQDVAGRFMDVVQRIDGLWYYTLDHVSLPAEGRSP